MKASLEIFDVNEVDLLEVDIDGDKRTVAFVIYGEIVEPETMERPKITLSCVDAQRLARLILGSFQ